MRKRIGKLQRQCRRAFWAANVSELPTNPHCHRLFGTAWQFSKEGLMASTNKSLAQMNKSPDGIRATKRGDLGEAKNKLPSRLGRDFDGSPFAK
jgi:hypothetical protein